SLVGRSLFDRQLRRRNGKWLAATRAGRRIEVAVAGVDGLELVITGGQEAGSVRIRERAVGIEAVRAEAVDRVALNADVIAPSLVDVVRHRAGRDNRGLDLRRERQG